jgi:nonsense-mediated mRNA decay protein 3
MLYLSSKSEAFCPRCGRSAQQFFNNICEACFLEGFKLLQVPLVVAARICPRCGSYIKGGKWIRGKGLEEAVLQTLKEAVKTHGEAEDPQIQLKPRQIDARRFKVQVRANARVKGISVAGEAEVEVRLRYETCDTCSRISGGYYEAIVQIRAENRLPSIKELQKCEEIALGIVDKAREKGAPLAFITKTERLKEGWDLYIGSTKVARQICHGILGEFGGRLTESPKLVGMRQGRKLYRITLSLRLPEFLRGDIIAIGEKIIEVKASNKGIRGIDLGTGERVSIGSREAVRLCNKEDAVKTVVISIGENIIEILDPETHKPVSIRKPPFLAAQPGEEILAAKTKTGIIVIPG